MKNTEGGQPASRPLFARRWELALVGALALGALALWLAFGRGGAKGAVAVATVGSGESQYTREIPLGEEGTLHIDAALPVTLEVRDGAIRFVDSVCPDHDCEGFGWLRAEGDWAACLPAQVTLRVGAE